MLEKHMFYLIFLYKDLEFFRIKIAKWSFWTGFRVLLDLNYPVSGHIFEVIFNRKIVRSYSYTIKKRIFWGGRGAIKMWNFSAEKFQSKYIRKFQSVFESKHATSGTFKKSIIIVLWFFIHILEKRMSPPPPIRRKIFQKKIGKVNILSWI